MGYLGLVPGERSTGTTVRRLGITKAGNGRLRRALVESAWTYRHPPRTGARKHYVLEKLPSSVKVSWRGRRRPVATRTGTLRPEPWHRR
jgi:transposase